MSSEAATFPLERGLALSTTVDAYDGIATQDESRYGSSVGMCGKVLRNASCSG